jgi:hypothetical protein
MLSNKQLAKAFGIPKGKPIHKRAIKLGTNVKINMDNIGLNEATVIANTKVAHEIAKSHVVKPFNPIMPMTNFPACHSTKRYYINRANDKVINPSHYPSRVSGKA